MTVGPEFEIKRKGYDCEKVDQYIDTIRDEYEKLSKENSHLKMWALSVAGKEEMVTKTLREIDLAFQDTSRSEANEEPDISKRGHILSCIRGFAFYFLVIIVLIAAIIFSGDAGGVPRSVGGYSYMRVLTGSMQREIPKGAFIVTKKVDPRSLLLYDNITFLDKNNTTTTHKIVEIFDNYGEEGVIAFQTQGVENDWPDEDIVIAPNVIGKVVYQSVFIGSAMKFVKDHAVIIVIFAILFLVLSAVLEKGFGTWGKKSGNVQITETLPSDENNLEGLKGNIPNLVDTEQNCSDQNNITDGLYPSEKRGKL